MIRRPPRSTRTDTLFPYTTLFRSRAQKGIDHDLKGLRLVIRNPMASVLYPFDPNMRAVALQFSCRFEGNNARVANDNQGRDIDCVHQRAIFGIGRHEYVKRPDPGWKSSASQELEDRQSGVEG